MSAVRQNDNMFVAAAVAKSIVSCKSSRTTMRFSGTGRRTGTMLQRGCPPSCISTRSAKTFEQRSAPWVTAGLMSACDYILSKLWWTRERECARELMVCLMVEMLRIEFYKIPTAVEVFSQPVGVFPQLVGFSGIAITNPVL